MKNNKIAGRGEIKEKLKIKLGQKWDKLRELREEENSVVWEIISLERLITFKQGQEFEKSK